MLNHISTSPSSIDDVHKDDHLHRKKRVGRACDLCRIKKTKCDGVKPCTRCVQDNKICVFSEKKKQKDKSHPSGYVELLETRLDLLTKSMEKIILMAKPHLPFFEKLMEENDTIAINDVITYLINEEGLLRNLPVEWENGAMIAANLITNDAANVERASKSFADYKTKRNEGSIDEKILDTESRPLKDSLSRSSTTGSTFNVIDDNANNMKLEKSINVQDLPFTGYTNDSSKFVEIQDGRKFSFSDFDSDSNSVYSQQQSFITDGTPPLDGLSSAPRGLFTNIDGRLHQNNKNSSVVSLTTKFEDHDIGTPSLTALNISKTQLGQQSKHQHNNPIRRSASLKQRHHSPTTLKFKSIGHVSKPVHNSHHSTSTIVSNDFDLPQLNSQPSSFPPTPENFENLIENFNSSGSLPSDAFKLTNYDEYQDFDIINNESIENYLNNPFLNKP